MEGEKRRLGSGIMRSTSRRVGSGIRKTLSKNGERGSRISQRFSGIRKTNSRTSRSSRKSNIRKTNSKAKAGKGKDGGIKLGLKLKTKNKGYRYFHALGVSSRVIEDLMNGIMMSESKSSEKPSRAVSDARTILYNVQEDVSCDLLHATEDRKSILLRKGEVIRASKIQNRKDEGKAETFAGVVIRDDFEIELSSIPYSIVKEVSPRDWTMEDVRQHIIVPSTADPVCAYVMAMAMDNEALVSRNFTYVSVPRTTKFLAFANALLTAAENTVQRRVKESQEAVSLADGASFAPSQVSSAANRSVNSSKSTGTSQPETDYDDNETFFWLDIFSVNQHEDPENEVRLRSVSVQQRSSLSRSFSRKRGKEHVFVESNNPAFASKVGIHKIIKMNASSFYVFCNDVSDPEYLKRGWCLWEMYGAAKASEENKKFNFEIIYPPEEENKLQDTLVDQKGFNSALKALTDVNWGNGGWRSGDDTQYVVETQIEKEGAQIDEDVEKKIANLLKRAYISCAEAILKHYNQTLVIHEDSGYALNKALGSIWNNEYRNPKKALPHVMSAVEYERKNFGPEHHTTVKSMVGLGSLLSVLGKYVEAESVSREIIETFENTVGRRQVSTATVLNTLGRALLGQAKYEESLKSHEEALDILTESNGPSHITVSKTYNMIGLVYKKQAKYDKAVENYEKAIQLLIDIKGEINTEVAVCYCNLGSVYVEQRSYDEALENYQKASGIRIALLGKSHPLTQEVKQRMDEINRYIMYS